MNVQFLARAVVASTMYLVSSAVAQIDGTKGPAQYADAAFELADPDNLATYHKMLASEPHLAGTPGDARTIDRLEQLMRAFGLSVERQNLWVYLSSPIEASVTVLPAGEDPSRRFAHRV